MLFSKNWQQLKKQKIAFSRFSPQCKLNHIVFFESTKLLILSSMYVTLALKTFYICSFEKPFDEMFFDIWFLFPFAEICALFLPNIKMLHCTYQQKREI